MVIRICNTTGDPLLIPEGNTRSKVGSITLGEEKNRR